MLVLLFNIELFFVLYTSIHSFIDRSRCSGLVVSHWSFYRLENVGHHADLATGTAQCSSCFWELQTRLSRIMDDHFNDDDETIYAMIVMKTKSQDSSTVYLLAYDVDVCLIL